MLGDKKAGFAKNYLHKGTKIIATGEVQTGSYEKDGKKIFTMDIIVTDTEFAESKGTGNSNGGGQAAKSDDFMQIPSGSEEQLPFD
jgi:single-strand DNA-binding protein